MYEICSGFESSKVNKPFIMSDKTWVWTFVIIFENHGYIKTVIMNLKNPLITGWAGGEGAICYTRPIVGKT